MVTDGAWVESWLSPPRFATYLKLAGGDRQRALELHEWSTRTNAALLHDFAHLEVGLRNLYDGGLQQAVVDSEQHWTQAQSSLVLFPNVNGADRRTHKDLDYARKAAGGPSAPGGKVLAELTFGFWVFLTSNRLASTVWAPYLEHLYPRGSDRGSVHKGLDQLRKARNRVAHHEPVRSATANGLVRQMHRYASYVSPELAEYVRETSSVTAMLAVRP